ncbi:MAG: FAD-dependent monooxygenase [Sulfobacillus thermotolerans]|nr:FAD-dependent monooxygenase [Sulfobacillus thermotolerans]
MSLQDIAFPAIVVGAGPVGMTAALALRHENIPVMVLEAESQDRLRPGSRAIFLHKATLQLLEDIAPSLGKTMAQHGVVWPVKRTWFEGQEVYTKTYPSPSPDTLPPFTSLPQVQIEQFLYQACLEQGVEFVWSSPVETLQIEPTGVVVKTRNGHTYTTSYVIGADGAHSTVRHAAHIDMEGTRSANTFIVVDVSEDPDDPLPLERVFHYNHPQMDGRNVLFVPFTGGWRIDLQLKDSDVVEDFAGLDAVRRWLPLVMDKKYADRITWVSTYQFLQVVANSFTDSLYRVLLVGEAAHLFAPFGARGFNSGVPDAVTAAQAIHQALNAKSSSAAQEAIAHFAEQRHHAAIYNRNAAGIALEHIQGASSGMQAKRYVAAALSPAWPALGRWLDEGPYGPRSGPSATTKY